MSALSHSSCISSLTSNINNINNKKACFKREPRRAAPSRHAPSRGAAPLRPFAPTRGPQRLRANADPSITTLSEAPNEALSPEEEDQSNMRTVLEVLDILKTSRDMTFNEVRLIMMIEDPREVERRRQLGIEDERGCSREDMADALVDVYEGRVPSDRQVLRELAKEMVAWPNLDVEVGDRGNPYQSPYAQVTNTGVDPKLAAQRARVDWDAASEIQSVEGEEKDKDIGNSVPPAVELASTNCLHSLLVFPFNSLKCNPKQSVQVRSPNRSGLKAKTS